MLASTLQQQNTLVDSKSARACWPASLALSFIGGEHGTVLKKSKHHGPLYVQKAFYPEGADCAHIYLLHPPGGIVSGDTLDITLSLNTSAKVLLTTPGATRLYRARQDQPNSEPLPQRVSNRLSVLNGSIAEWLPAETIVFNGASIDLLTEVHLDSSSQFCGWEITCLGLPASNQPFLTGKFSQSFNIVQDGVPKVIDRMQFNAESPYLNALCGFQGKPVYASLVAGPFNASIDKAVEQLREFFEKNNAQHCCTVTALNDFVIVRYLGDGSDQARQLFIQAWKIIRPILNNRTAIEPRIWAT